MIGEDDKKRVIFGAALDILYLQTQNLYKREGLSGMVKKSSRATKELARSIKAGPNKSWESIGIITKTKIHELLGVLKAQGIKISIIHGVDDKFFSMDDVQKMIKSKTIDGFYSTKTTHNEVYLNPRPLNALTDSALDSLEALCQKEEEKETEVEVAV